MTLANVALYIEHTVMSTMSIMKKANVFVMLVENHLINLAPPL